VGLLSWLGLRQGEDYPNLDLLAKELRRALPDDESVVIRYIAIVIVLLARVAWADGGLSQQEEEILRELLTRVERLTPTGVDAVCAALKGSLPVVTNDELEVCFRELKSLCDGRQRLEILRLLTQVAAADGAPSRAEQGELAAIAEELGVSLSNLALVQEQVAAGSQNEPAPRSAPSPPPDEPQRPKIAT
jgi:DnaJ like chaperone protein